MCNYIYTANRDHRDPNVSQGLEFSQWQTDFLFLDFLGFQNGDMKK